MKINIGCVIPGHTPKNISGHEVPKIKRYVFNMFAKSLTDCAARNM